MDIIVAPIVVRQTQPFTQGVWSNIPIMAIVEQALGQQGILVTTPKPTNEITLACAYCQQVGYEFQNFPFMDDKLKQMMKELKTSLPPTAMNKPMTQVSVSMP